MAQSAVFRTMFTGNWSEKCNEIVIKDTEPEVMRQLVSAVNFCSVNFNSDAIFAIKLKIVAHKYEIAFLEQLADHQVRQLVAVENVMELMQLASEFREDELKRCAIEFVVNRVDCAYSDIPAINLVSPQIAQEVNNAIFDKLRKLRSLIH